MVTRFGVVGDIHGNLDLMYKFFIDWERKHKKNIHAILQVGDFQVLRDEKDFQHLYVPPKYAWLSDFPDYFSGLKKAPFLTLFIGGNHESWGFLNDHKDGGFLAPNIYFLGRAGTLEVRDKKIGGLTGIYSPKHYESDFPSIPCYNHAYYRKSDLEKLSRNKLDILLTHDWAVPKALIDISLEVNPFIFDENLNPPTLNLVNKVSPSYVFSGHRHAFFLEGSYNESRITYLQSHTSERSFNSATVIELE
ncbi:hypothetical protein HON03_01980 [archaeon]|nr:hypothetical protein [archaeon]MBT5288113.1 hypothetical protein [archaeon]